MDEKVVQEQLMRVGGSDGWSANLVRCSGCEPCDIDCRPSHFLRLTLLDEVDVDQ